MTRKTNLDRGGHSHLERAHARDLIRAGAEDVWGWNSPAGQARVEARIRWMIQTCQLSPGLNVLECGCGTGIFTRHLAKTGVHLTAVDIAEELLQEAGRQCPPQVRFIQMDLENPAGLPDGSYDVLCGVSVLHHLKLPETLVALRRKLKGGARFAFSEPNLLNPINRYLLFTADPDKRRRRGVSPTEMAFRPRELASLFREAGFTVHGVAHRDFLHPAVPKGLIPLVRALGSVAERTPLLKAWSGSLWISGTA